MPNASNLPFKAGEPISDDNPMPVVTGRELVDLLSNATATGSIKDVGMGGQYNMAVVGTFAGATLQLQFVGPDGVTFVNVPGASFTANGVVSVNAASGSKVRMLVTGSPTAMFASLNRVGG